MINFLVILFIFFSVNNSQAFSIIRDDEAEKFIFKAITPILQAANIPKEEFHLYIVDDKSINAFTTGGNKIFINVGLITNFDDVKVLQGVVAHEIGHLLANHVTLTATNHRELASAASLGNFLGVIGGALLGSGEIAAAAGITSSQLAATKFFSYSRSFENEADNIALKLLKQANVSSAGLEQILKKLHRHENESVYFAYARTHPSSISRINNIKEFNYGYATKIIEDSKLQQQYQHIAIKFKAFTGKIPSLTKEYAKYDSNSAKYLKAIISHREGKSSVAINLIDELLKNNNNDLYLHELKGQIFFETGSLNEAVNSYSHALELSPYSALIKLQYAISLVHIKTNDNALLEQAKNLIEEAMLSEKENILLFHYLAIIYGKLGFFADADLAAAEKFVLLGDDKKAIFFAKKALKNKASFSSQTKLIKVNDLLNAIEVQTK
jgi:predicted Zn-dependent protease